MGKYNVALTPPMGWNSWDVYGASVTESEVRANAEYMAKYMKEYGWQYIIVDIQWYEPKAHSCVYNPFTELEMDQYSRLIPAVNRFPSSADGSGFRHLSDYIHELGLKFGIHIMRGIPRQAVYKNSRILGTSIRARDIAATDSICKWNTDMYGVNPDREGASEYYDSLIKLYASWGVDYIKVDDTACAKIGDTPYFAGEISLIRDAIDKCGRDMVLSLSPGPASLRNINHLKANANMWRMTDDFWDRWEDLYNEFEKCNKWSKYVGECSWPDADMLPLGTMGIRTDPKTCGQPRKTNFTKDEQITMMTLWCIFRSPLMVGCELTLNDEWTLNLLTNSEVLRILNYSRNGYQIYRKNDKVIWKSQDVDGSYYVALFNISEKDKNFNVSLDELGLSAEYKVRDLWGHRNIGDINERITCNLKPHACRLLKLYI